MISSRRTGESGRRRWCFWFQAFLRELLRQSISHLRRVASTVAVSIQMNIQKHLRCQNVMRRRGPDNRNRSVDCAAELTSAGTAHAVVFWVDYACRVADESRDGGAGDNYDLISTASSSHRQLVRKLLESVAITEEHVAVGAKVYVKASFGADPDGIEDHAFSFEVHLQ